MSKYQYYEFQAIDKPLSKAQQDKVRALSSRAEVNARSARFVYNYGDFRGNKKALMWEHFDAMLYMSNWGTRQLLLRFPLTEMDVKALRKYTVDDMIDCSSQNGKLLLNLNFQEVGEDVWLEGEGWLSSLLELREDLRKGDLRLLYLAWLKACDEYEEYEGVAEDALEPPVPAGLQALSEAHKVFIEWVDLDIDLVSAAAQASPSLPTKLVQPSLAKVEDELEALLASAKSRLLQAAQRGELADINIELGQELRTELTGKPTTATGQRTVAQLRELTEQAAEQRAKVEHERKEAERLRALEALAQREPQAWQQVETLCEYKIASAYDEAVALLVQLNDLAQHRGETIDARLAPLLERWKGRPALMRRLQTRGLVS